MAFRGQAFAFWRPLQAPNFLRPASPGSVAASRPPVCAQLLLLPAAAAGPAPASRQPLWTRAPNVLKPVPTVASSGPAPALRRRLHDPDFLQPASPGPAPPPGGLCRPTLASSRPLQGALWSRWPLRPQLVPQSASAVPAAASPRPLQLPDLFRSASPGRAPPACHWPLEAQDLTSSRPRQAQPPASRRPAQAQPLPPSRLSTPTYRLNAASPGQSSSCLSAAPPGPAPASQWPRPASAFWRPLQATNFLSPAPPVPVAASRPPVQAQLLLLPAVALGPAPAPRQPLWTRLRPCSRSAAFVDPKRPEAGPHDGLSGPGCCSLSASPRPRIPPASLARPSSSCRRPLQAHAGLESRLLQGSLVLPAAPAGPIRRPVVLRRPSSCLSVASPAARLPQAQSLPFGGLSRPRTSSGRPLQAPLRPPSLPSRPSSSCSRLRPRVQHRPHDNLFGLGSGHSSRSAAFGGPKRPEARLTSSRPRQAQPPASRRPAQAQPLHPSGLSTPSSRLTAASPGQSSSCLSAAPPGPAPASQWPR
ncbi:PREDICTED: proline-rich protein 36-like [Cercocebus atys]|uniref:proline-rich protein 36-like n=1 Tax=Cercocebus atys TaxID=9531 RepID=UPI0005F48BC9|nr:PREDICTED: proline-rich protein 36-like [Cercocebus atys]